MSNKFDETQVDGNILDIVEMLKGKVRNLELRKFEAEKNIYPKTVSIDPAQFVGSHSTNFSFDAAQYFSRYLRDTTPGDGHTIDTGFVLRAGVYTVKIFGVTSSFAGKLDWSLNGVTQTTGQDWYSAASTYNVEKTFTLTVPSSGYHILRGTVNGKHASSSSYNYYISLLSIYPSAY